MRQATALNSTLHIETWFIRLIGCFELAGAIGLWLPKFRTAAAVSLSLIMLGAIGCHVGADQLRNIGPATVLFILLAALIMFDPQNKVVVQSV